ncbi:M60 family metallopeptidase [Sunxiuqinia elliptica]|uniref:Putative binding domain-containing protein, N-terminal n=1 Tax=Sunxiuqinia elliptica TaxID=655355 RepID=A0A1I2IH21_9BACT|nr:M60 family metallopeptidase [Sunxiuqinia elliptica]SFF41629.1 Putative binding domain-containing protein, N-terminal [Sunxiuqinia elliptica]
MAKSSLNLLGLFLTFTLFFQLGCKDEKFEEESQFQIEKSSLTQDLTEDGGTIIIPVLTKLNADDWSVSSSVDWCIAAKSYDSNNRSITISVSPNEGVESRETTLNVNSILDDYTITVRQLGYGPAILVKEHAIALDKQESQFIITVTSNVEYSIGEPLVDWVAGNPVGTKSSSLVSKDFHYIAEENAGLEKRSAMFKFIYNEDSSVADSCIVTQAPFVPSTDDIPEDIKIAIKSATASSEQQGTGIDASFDNDKSTIYHSAWNNTSSNYFPIRLNYFFEDVSEMDYIVYYPRQDGGANGSMKEFELWIATEENNTLTKYGEYDFQGQLSASRIAFNVPVQNPIQIQFVVKSGVGNSGQGFVSCAEMEFYRYSEANQQYLNIFTDKSCSELKAGIGEAEIDEMENPFFRSLALKIYRNEYDTEFRVQDYKAYTNPDFFASEARTSPYSLRDNATGIYATEGEELVVFANDFNTNISLFIQGNESAFSGTSYSLLPGVNKIKAETTGLIYVMYHTRSTTESPVKIHIATGTVNGYFDKSKYTKEDWERLLSKATYDYFDVLGEYAHLTFETSKFRNYTPDGLALINKYDDLVYKEWEFMGYKKYNRMPGNRLYFLGINSSYMYATNYYTAYESSTLVNLCDLTKFSTSSCWGPAHEVGHCNQTRPGLKWIGMTEVTNNIHSMHIQTSWGNQSRLIVDGVYNTAFNNLLNRGIPHNGYDGDKGVFVKLVPFWQLKLYLMDALGKDDFYKDLYEYMRNQDYSQATNDGFYQLDFVRAACRIANLDLTPFFEAWGFLEPVDITVNDYATKQFTITQNEIDDLKAEIAAKNYPKPEHSNIFEITDNNVSNYR